MDTDVPIYTCRVYLPAPVHVRCLPDGSAHAMGVTHGREDIVKWIDNLENIKG